jgi:hypothetical protein
MTGYQKAKIVAMWLKSHKTLTIDEFAATVDVSNITDPNPTVHEPAKPTHQEIVQLVFGS